MPNETVNERIYRIKAILDVATANMTHTKAEAITELQALLQDAYHALELAKSDAVDVVRSTADEIITAHRFIDFDNDARYVFQISAQNEHPVLSLTKEDNKEGKDDLSEQPS